MSEGPARSSTESSSAATSGLDFEDTALTLRPPGSDPDRKRAASTSDPAGSGSPRASDAPPSPKARVVGWPPVSRNRRNALPRGKFVKVAVAGAPYQRKVDLEAYAGYEQLLAALQDKFTAHFTVRECTALSLLPCVPCLFLVAQPFDRGWMGAGRGANEEMQLVDVVSGAEYVPTYEDKDGDWMLVGDVPWRMFVETCQRLRLMKSSEVVNLGTCYHLLNLVYRALVVRCIAQFCQDESNSPFPCSAKSR
ncbi:unnamed protein product [Urochloa decumbens]|uniref:Auxin-responsive protein n=1 Tax=Urochloa decumbens TaxID=240449 RepID=A0ABC9GK82_9POAL